MRLRRCPVCSRYTLRESCPADGAATASAHPPSFSLERELKYGKWRRVAGKR